MLYLSFRTTTTCINISLWAFIWEGSFLERLLHLKFRGQGLNFRILHLLCINQIFTTTYSNFIEEENCKTHCVNCTKDAELDLTRRTDTSSANTWFVSFNNNSSNNCNNHNVLWSFNIILVLRTTYTWHPSSTAEPGAQATSTPWETWLDLLVL